MTPSIGAFLPEAGEQVGAAPYRGSGSDIEAAYVWNLGTDALAWAPEIETLLGASVAALKTGRHFAARLVSDSICSREKAIRSGAQDPGTGVAYVGQYGLICDVDDRDAPIVWLEDRGRWFAGPDGVPDRAEGRVRIVTRRVEADRQSALPSGDGALSALIGRAAFVEHLDRKLGVLGRKPVPFALLVGACRRDATNASLVRVVDVLRVQMRTRDVLARIAPDRLGLLLESCDPDQMRTAADRLLAALSTQADEADIVVFGGAVAPRDGRTVGALMARAERALADCTAVTPFVAYRPALG